MGICCYCTSKWTGKGTTKNESLADLITNMRKECYCIEFRSIGTYSYIKFFYNGMYFDVPIVYKHEEKNWHAYVF
jgi:hypothetical protein